MENAAVLFDKGLNKARADDDEVYWSIKRQQINYLAKLGKGQQAVDELLSAVESDRENVQLWISLVHAYCALGETQNALLQGERAADKFPENALLHNYLGDIFCGMEQYDKAFKHWKRAQQLEPSLMDSSYSMAACYECLEDHDNAARVWQSIADDFSVRGFEVETNDTRSNAARCKKCCIRAELRGLGKKIPT